MELLQEGLAALHQLVAAHPILYTLVVLPLSLYGIRKLEGAIPKLADWADDYQEKALLRAGLSQEEIAMLEEHEAKDLRASADELDKRAAARKAAAANAPQAQAPAAAKP